MKKIFAILLLIAMIGLVCGCGQTPAPETTAPEQTQPTTAPEQPLLVGYARIDVTPKITVPLRGFGSTSDRMSDTVLEPLYGTCIAITDDMDNTILLYALDFCGSYSTFTKDIRASLEESTGIPEKNIFFNASHTHAGPDFKNSNEKFYISYLKELRTLLTDAGLQAIADRQPAEMTYGSVETENMTFSRHYEYAASDGTMKYGFGGVGAFVNGGDSEHCTEADETMHVIRFAREGKDVVMVNWRAHPLLHSGKGKRFVSADFVGGFRTAVELTQDCHFAYFQGAAGNMNSISAIASEIRTEDNGQYGAILADYVAQCLEQNMKQTEGKSIQLRQTILELEAQVELNAITIGESVAFVTAPNELFDLNSAYMEENSPYPMSFTLGYTNGGEGYVPSIDTFDYGDYIWYEVEQTKFQPGTAEQIQDTFLQMLEDMHGATASAGTAITPVQVEAEPITELPLYWNVYRMDYAPGGKQDMSSRMPEADGYYHVVFASEEGQQTLRVMNPNHIEIIDHNDIVGLSVNQDGIVTDVKVIRECTGGYAANRAFVLAVEGTAVTCSTAAENGVQFQLELTDATGIYDVSTQDDACGAKATLAKGDQIIALMDGQGEICAVYILRHSYCDDLTHENHCVCGGACEGMHGTCEAITDWIPWGDDPTEWDCLPQESGHYYLTRDVFVPCRQPIQAGRDITICLNGKTIHTEQERIFATAGKMNICDCRFTCEDGRYNYEGSIEIGYDTATSSGGIFYCYKGTELNLYSGNLRATSTMQNGALIYVTAGTVTNLYNANLYGGTVLDYGGSIYMSNGTVNIYGGMITGGNASKGGGAIYLKNGTLRLSGSPVITGNFKADIAIAQGKQIVLEDARLQTDEPISILLMAGEGVFAENVTKEAAAGFTAYTGKIKWDPDTGDLSVVE